MSRFRPASAASGSVLVAVALGAVAFVAGGGTQVGRVAPVEVVAIIACGALLAWIAVQYEARRPLYGGGAVVLFALLTVLTGLSMGWSVTPDLTLQELGRTFTYLAVFATGAALAAVAPRGARALLPGILLAALAACLWALATRVWPASLGGEVIGARLGKPFDYWNALGGMAALGVPGALWLGSRRDGSRAVAAAVYPAMGVLILTVLLTQSRGALAAAILAAAGWLAFVPLRLRTTAVIVVPAVCVAPVAAWALSKPAFTSNFSPLGSRESVATTFGLLLLATLAVLAVAGAAAVELRRDFTLSVDQRRRAGTVLLAALAVVVVGGAVALATTGGGIGGRLHTLTAKDGRQGASGAGRLGSASSSRGEYWRQAFHVFKDAPLTGRGADGFTLARLQYRTDIRAANHAHGYLPQTAADLGLLGLAASLALFGAWLWAAARTLGVRRCPPWPEWTPDRMALWGLGLCALAYGLQSAIDWTWFIPGITVAAMLAAGFVAGRGPLAPGAGEEARVPSLRLSWSSADPLRVIAGAAVLVVALVCAWAAWQPQRSQSATDKAVQLSDDGKYAAAVAQADDARAIDPYSPDPLYAKATALAGAGHKVAAYRQLEQAVAEHPRDPDAWVRLGQFELDEFDLPGRALRSAGAATTVDPRSVRAFALGDKANAALAQTAPAAQP